MIIPWPTGHTSSLLREADESQSVGRPTPFLGTARVCFGDVDDAGGGLFARRAAEREIELPVRHAPELFFFGGGLAERMPVVPPFQHRGPLLISLVPLQIGQRWVRLPDRRHVPHRRIEGAAPLTSISTESSPPTNLSFTT